MQVVSNVEYLKSNVVSYFTVDPVFKRKPVQLLNKCISLRKT